MVSAIHQNSLDSFVRETPGRIANPFSFFNPTDIKLFRDGGSMELEGSFNKSTNVTVRFDGKFNSPTRGQFFVTVKPFLKPAQPERPMTQGEMQTLSSTLTRYQAQVPGRQPLHAQMNRHLKTALQNEQPVSIKPASIPTSIAGPNADARVDSSLWIDLMPGPGPRPNAIASVTIAGVGFNDAPPKFKVGKIEVYEKGSDKLVATINNPKAQSSGLHGRGEQRDEFRVEIPKDKLDLQKRYTFVASVGINGAAQQKVRSEYVPVDKVF